jgi:cytochrome c oxidase subunit 2
MALAIILVLLLVGSVIFNFVSPWQATPVASNWGSIDTTIVITLIITGIFFIGITLFVAYVLVKYRHRASAGNGRHQASYEPDNKKMEWWLTGITTVGICALLAPGLVVYSDFVHVPKEATEVEVVGKQWMWSYRLPGEDGKLGQVKVKLIDFSNPFGIDPEDPHGQDDVLINSNELHLPIDKPVKMLLRSLDVLHNFYVPHFRAKMDMVPGQITYFWFTPTREGSFEVLCAEYCGVAHYNMQGTVVVNNASDYQRWLDQQPRFAYSANSQPGNGAVEQGRQLAEGSGCLACHSIDGSKSLGPTWKGLVGKTETLQDGSTVVVDAAYFNESITDPAAKIVQGYPPVMVAYAFSEQQLESLMAYSKSLDTAAVEGSDKVDEAIRKGQQLSQQLGCIACHSVDGSKSLGPSWKGINGRTETMADGSSVLVNDDYLRESIVKPSAKLVKDYPPVMQPYTLDEQQLQQLLAYMKSVN